MAVYLSPSTANQCVLHGQVIEMLGNLRTKVVAEGADEATIHNGYYDHRPRSSAMRSSSSTEYRGLNFEAASWSKSKYNIDAGLP